MSRRSTGIESVGDAIVNMGRRDCDTASAVVRNSMIGWNSVVTRVVVTHTVGGGRDVVVAV